MNQINAIVPYKWNGLWVFDDPEVSLHREPFVAGSDKFFDIVTKPIQHAEDGFICIFSKDTFPGHRFVLTWVRDEMGGCVYREDTLKMEGWLCPALFKYFETTPQHIYLQVAPMHPKSYVAGSPAT